MSAELLADYAGLRRMSHELEGVSLDLLTHAEASAPATGGSAVFASHAFEALTARMTGLSRRAADLDDALDLVRLELALADDGVASALRFEG